jgi:hypothetical protein
VTKQFFGCRRCGGGADLAALGGGRGGWVSFCGGAIVGVVR